MSQLDAMNGVYFDRELMKAMREPSPFWRLSWVYRSNWRVLHIDGLEGGLRLKMNMGKVRQPFQYFQYAEKS